MINRKYKYFIFSGIFLLLFFLVILVINAADGENAPVYDVYTEIVPTTNFFAQPEDQRPVTPYAADLPLSQGYQLIKENDNFILYLDPSTVGIAVYDKAADYLWYSSYPKYREANYLEVVKTIIASGVAIECFESEDSDLPVLAKYSGSVADCRNTVVMTSEGCEVELDFFTVGISFKISLSLSATGLDVTMLNETLEEKPYKTPAMKYPKQYKLKSLAFFPYFGSENYQINAYSFIPDGSGALIRYTDEANQTALIKRIYGLDLGMQTRATIYDHISNQQEIALPIYGITHGYQQAAVFVEILGGAGAAELHAYPYMYDNINLNRTFFRFLARDKFYLTLNVGDTIGLIEEEINPGPYRQRYTFLRGDEASYLGMAETYRRSLGLESLGETGDIPLKLDIINQDYKPGLFGKNYIEMTTYDQVQTIIRALLDKEVKDMEVTLIGWNKNGFYDNTPITPRPAGNLGGKSKFKALVALMQNHNLDLYVYDNPLIVDSKGLNTKIIKRVNLELFEYDYRSSLGLKGYHNHIDRLGTTILKNQEIYRELGISKFNFEYLGEAAYSFAYQGEIVPRAEMIRQLLQEMEKLREYKIGLTRPNDYLLPYIASFYQTPYEASKYAFETDSVPFLPYVLAGSVNLYSEPLNFVSDQDLFSLRLIEYNIYPSFILTHEPSYYFRHCNFEYIYTSEFALWQEIITSVYQRVNSALRYVRGAKMIEHKCLAEGIFRITYDNGVAIYLNYAKTPYDVSGNVVNPKDFLVLGGGA